jgi:hypothetical protein
MAIFAAVTSSWIELVMVSFHQLSGEENCGEVERMIPNMVCHVLPDVILAEPWVTWHLFFTCCVF